MRDTGLLAGAMPLVVGMEIGGKADTVSMRVPTAASTIEAIDLLMPGWKQLVMVCRACEKRSKAPKKFGAKKVARALSSALRSARQPKTRIVQTTCMGLCPKQALAVAASAPDGTLHVIAWHKFDDANAALQALLDVAAGADPLSPTHQEQQ